MHPSPMHYFPLTPLFMLILLAAFLFLVALIEVGVVTYASEKMGIGRRYLFTILLLSLLGSGINIPVAQMPANNIVVEHVVSFMGVLYVVPEVELQGRTIIAVNVGGAVIPLLLSVYLVIKNRIYVEAAIGVTVMTVITHLLARPVPGVGIALPTLLPPILAALLALVISRQHSAPLAYISGSMGCLLGADVLNLYRIGQLGAPIASIGGAGVSDGIFLTGLLAVLLA